MKIITSKWFCTAAMAMFIALILGEAALGQQLGNLAKMQHENAAKLREYTWKSRTEISTGGDTKIVRLDQIRHAVDGTLQTTQLSLTAPELPTRGLRGMIAKKKKAQFQELIGGLTTLASSYGKLPAEKMRRFIENASITPENTGTGKLYRISGTDVLQPGDSMSVWIDPTARKQRKIEVRTKLEGQAVRIVSEFKEIVGGPTYIARAVIELPEEEIVIAADNFEHVRQETVGGVGKR